MLVRSAASSASRSARWAAVGLTLALGAMGGQVEAQPVFLDVTRADGLPSDYVNTIYQDRAGFLWFGTDAGLARYDGERVVTYTSDDGLPHPFVYSVVQDGDGTLWVGTYDGLARRVGNRFVREPGPFEWGSVEDLDVDARGQLVVRGRDRVGVRWTEGAGPARWRTTAQSEFEMETYWGGAALVGEAIVVTATAQQTRDVLLVLHPEGDGFRPAPFDLPTAWGQRLVVRPGGEGTFLIGGTGGVLARVRVRRGRLEILDTATVGPIRYLEADGSGGAYVFVTGPRPGVYHVDRDLRLDPEPLHPGPVQTLARDYEGGLWIGTFGDGAARLQGRHLRQLSAQPATRITRGPDGAVWATGRGLLRIDPATLATTTFGTRDFRELQFDALGRLWVSSGPDVLVGASPAGPFVPHASEPGWISGIDVQGDTLRASAYGGGVLRFVRGVPLDTLAEGRGLPTGMVEGLVRTRSALWAITRSHGLFRIDGSRVRRTGREEGLPSSAVYTVYEASDGAIWVGTDRGAGRLAAVGDRRAATLTTPALRGQRITLFFERPSTPGVVWAVGGRALYRADGGRLVAAGGVPLVRDRRASINAAVYVPDEDRLFLATTSGVVSADLRAIEAGASAPPRVAWLGVYANEREIALEGTATRTQLPDLRPGRHRVEVAFALLSFAGPVRAEVRIDGGAWRDVGDERRVVLAGTGPGRHRVEVRAVSGRGGVTVRPARLEFYVLPFWWQRPALLVVLGALVAVGLALVVRHLSQRRLRARLRVLEAERETADRLQRERERISRDLHDHVGAQLSSLLAGVELARLARRAQGDGAPAPSPQPDPLDGVETDARTTMRQLRETIWALHQEAVTVRAFCDRVRADLTGRLNGRVQPTTDVSCEGEGDRSLSPVQALNLYRIVQEAVTNVLKHAGATSLSVLVRHEGHRVVVEVRDDGTFTPPSEDDGLSGFGMRSMRARAEALGGVMDLVIGAGTTVRVSVPIEGTGGAA